MRDVTVTAVRSFLFKGRSITKGESVTMTPIDASIENRQGNVSLARVQTRSMKAEAPKPPEKPTRTSRTRRNNTKLTDDEEQAPSTEPSQRYRRRDMTAEDPT